MFWRFLTKKLRLENGAIYVAGSPLARPIGRLGPFPFSLVGLLFTKLGENHVPCPYHLASWRNYQTNGNQNTGISVYSFFILAIFLCSPLSLKF